MPIYYFSQDLKLSYQVYGQQDGVPAFYFHGLPGCRLEAEILHNSCLELGVQLFAVDRFGYGQSSRVSVNRYQNWITAIENLANHLSIKQFLLYAVSGGGPYALAVASALSDQVMGTTISGCLGPLQMAFLRKKVALMPRILLTMAIYMPKLFKLSIGNLNNYLAKNHSQDIAKLLALINGGADRQLLKTTEFSEFIARVYKEAFRQGYEGSMDDMKIAFQPWPFSLSKVVNLQLWHGSSDKIVECVHSQWLAQQIRNTMLNIVEGEGHLSLPFKYHREIILSGMQFIHNE